jgi:hypothetical protein
MGGWVGGLVEGWVDGVGGWAGRRWGVYVYGGYLIDGCVVRCCVCGCVCVFVWCSGLRIHIRVLLLSFCFDTTQMQCSSICAVVLD